MITIQEIMPSTIIRKRIDWIDALKGFAIFCVTLGHCDPWLPMKKYIYSFHMFVFFFISGFLFTVKDDTKKMIVNCLKKLLLPFLVWNTVSCLVDLWRYRDFELFIQEFFVINGKLTDNPPIWFLLVLFISELIFILLRLHKHTVISVGSMAICIVLWVSFGNLWVLWKLNLVPMALCFFLFGYVFKPFVDKIGKIYFLVPLCAVSVFFALQNIRIVYTYGKFGNYLYCILAAFAGTLFMVGLFSSVEALSRLKFFASWGKNSLLIMAMQYFVFSLITLVSEKFLEINLMEPENTFLSVIVAVFTILLISLTVCIFKRLTFKSKILRVIGESFGVYYDKPLPNPSSDISCQ